MLVNSLCDCYKITNRLYTAGCAGDEALAHSFASFRLGLANISKADFDLISSIQFEIIQQCPVQLFPWHVKGHQDDGIMPLYQWVCQGILGVQG